MKWSHQRNLLLPVVVFFVFLLVPLSTIPNNQYSVKYQLDKFERVRLAEESSAENCQSMFAKRGLSFPHSKVFVRIFKYENIVELWAFDSKKNKYLKIKEYPICFISGDLGPKRQEGDGQVPEGFYRISHFNPSSKYHLSLQINYPNASDKIRTSNPAKPGNLIMIHGDCVSAGCVSIQDDPIEEFYWILLNARDAGQRDIPVHVFPCKMNSLRYKIKCYLERDNSGLLSFWEEIKRGYEHFEERKQLPSISVESDGRYIFDTNKR